MSAHLPNDAQARILELLHMKHHALRWTTGPDKKPAEIFVWDKRRRVSVAVGVEDVPFPRGWLGTLEQFGTYIEADISAAGRRAYEAYENHKANQAEEVTRCVVPCEVVTTLRNFLATRDPELDDEALRLLREAAAQITGYEEVA